MGSNKNREDCLVMIPKFTVTNTILYYVANITELIGSIIETTSFDRYIFVCLANCLFYRIMV